MMDENPDYRVAEITTEQLHQIADQLPGNRLGDKMITATVLAIWIAHIADFNKAQFLSFAGDMFDQFQKQQIVIDNKNHAQTRQNLFDQAEIPARSTPTEDDFKTECF